MRLCSNKFFSALIYLLLFHFGTHFAPLALANPSCEYIFSYKPSVEYEFPLCGNGVKDPGELCDDGNRVDNDGCNSWCNMFDAFTGTCTMAGKNKACSNKMTEIDRFNAQQSVFCDLTCIDIHPNSSYVLLADDNRLLRYSLFTDKTTNLLEFLPVNQIKTWYTISSLILFPDDLSFLTWEPTSLLNELYLVDPNGVNGVSIAIFPNSLRPVQPFSRSTTHKILPKMLLLPNSRDVLLAALPKISSNSGGMQEYCVHVYKISIPKFSIASAKNDLNYYRESDLTPFAKIPCLLYNALTDENIKLNTFTIADMIPQYFRYDSCMHPHIFSMKCYILYLQSNDMQFVEIHIPSESGIDLAYRVYQATSSNMNNALGLPIKKQGTGTLSTMQYTLRGSCFSAQNMVYSPLKNYLPPPVSLGNACPSVDLSLLSCYSPFNNPFITNVVSSPNLIPEGLSIQNTHGELSKIFSDTICNDSVRQVSQPASPSFSGIMFYRDILKEQWLNTLPVDFVTIPSTHDIMYITPISIGLITSKQSIVFDVKNKGYCKPTDVLYCPPGYFGSVQHGTCHLCNSTASPGYQTSVSWQIRCAFDFLRKGSTPLSSLPNYLKTAAVSDTFERYVAVMSKGVEESHLLDSICLYMAMFNKTCPNQKQSVITPKQQFNVDADLEDSEFNNSLASNKLNLIPCLIKQAETKYNMNLSLKSKKSESAEYVSYLTSHGSFSSIIESVRATLDEYSDIFANLPEIASGVSTVNVFNKTLLYETCLNKISVQSNLNNLQPWIQCAVSFIANQTNPLPSKGRRLLQQQTGAPAAALQPVFNENQKPTLCTTSAIVYAPLNPVQNVPLPPPSVADNKSSSSESFPMWIGIAIAVVAFLVLFILLFFYYRRRMNRFSY